MGKLHNEGTTSRIIGSAFEVHNLLGYGLLEKVYQRALQVELIKRGSRAEMKTIIKVSYKGIVVGEYYADLFVDDFMIRVSSVAGKFGE